ncbi:acyl-CoA dehydrogenase family protein [Ammoniphilus sp. YIM 78166]|uniref:acyl-CoA dehydrogenase family protein n=1 Tax=Ammoniphilus sp. YIM 78166 TaxID=1644106 RepID=UPI001430BCB9|nr:acyl-CoA dehydrogenase family protein [Ammoniphilus sp. YIM 78166]
MNYQKWGSGNEVNWFNEDPLLLRYTKRYLSDTVYSFAEPRFQQTGAWASARMDPRAAYTDRDGAPKLIRYNRSGEEVNQIWYNEGYLQTVREGYGTGVVSLRYDRNAPQPIPFMVNSTLFFLLSQAETGFTCPVILTQSVAFVLEKFGSEQQRQQYLHRLGSHDPNLLIQGGTFLTEIQGGSDVGATQTIARKEKDHYLLTGEKWFASNCDAEVSLVLARVNQRPGTGGLGLFLVPRELPDGKRNNISIRRLKDKLGVRAVASGELILHDAVGYLIGKAEHGFKYMAEALNVSRLGTALGGLAIARRAFLEACLYTAQRRAFGQTVFHFPLVREALADLITQIEAGWSVIAQAITLFDEVHTFGRCTREKQTLLRLLLSLAKYRCSELGVTTAKEALELHGGNGYIEEYVTPRLLRDAIVNPIWEGTSNIQALEILKILQKEGSGFFIQHLHETLDSITIDRPQADQLRTQVNQLDQDLLHILKQDPLTQNTWSKHAANQMYDLFASVHLLEEAQFDIVTTNDYRRTLVLHRWLNRKTHYPQPLSEEEYQSLVCFACFHPKRRVD